MTNLNKYDDSYLNPLHYEDTYSMLGGMMIQGFSSGRRTVNTEISPRPKARNINHFPFAFLRGHSFLR